MYRMYVYLNVMYGIYGMYVCTKCTKKKLQVLKPIISFPLPLFPSFPLSLFLPTSNSFSDWIRTRLVVCMYFLS